MSDKTENDNNKSTSESEAEETVEAKVVELQERKRALAGDVLSGAAKSASGIGRTDLGFLLS